MIGFNGGLIGSIRTPIAGVSIPGMWTPREQECAVRGGNWVAFATDPDYNSVSLLLHGDGTNGSQTFLDNSPRVKTLTAFGTAQISTAIVPKFGVSSLLFDNSRFNYITAPSNTDFAFGTGDFCVEAWIYQRSQSQYAALLEIGNHQTNTGILFITGSNGFQIYSNAFIGGSGNPLTLNVWQHVAYSRSGTTLRVFLNGIQQGSNATFSNNLSVTTNVSIGFAATTASTDYDFDGYIDDIRVTKGVPRYTANFPVPTEAFPNS